jgi:cytochrome c556
MKRLLALAVLGIALAVPGASVHADGHGKALGKAVKARQAYMTVIGFNMGGLGAMAKGESEYDAATATAMAGNLSLLSQMNTGGLWPKGTDNAAMPGKTRALPKAWEDYAAVAEKHEAFTKAAANLAAEAGKGKEALGAAMKDVGKSCGGCHKPFRAPKKK